MSLIQKKLLFLILTTPIFVVKTYAGKDPAYFNLYLNEDTTLVYKSNWANTSLDNSKMSLCSNKIKLLAPSALITYGVAARLTKPIRRFDVSINNMVQRSVEKHHTFDNYIQYLPLMAAIGLSQIGVEAKHPLKERIFTFSTSALLTLGTVQLLKNSTKINRPDGSRRNSFPSGHTATAFLGAHLVAKEYGSQNKLIAVGAYTVATTVATMRIINKKHWFSDVVAGAGVGILSVEAAYLLAPKLIKSQKHGNKPIIAPYVFNKQKGATIIYRLK